MTTDSASRFRSLWEAAAVAAAAAALAMACKESNLPGSPCYNERYTVYRRTSTKLLAFSLMPSTIYFQSIDVRRDTIQQTWDTSKLYYGGACLRFQTTDSVRIDTSGVFQFFMSGSNGGTVWQRIVSEGVEHLDSLDGYVFAGCEGDGGTYRLLPDSTIQLTWANGQEARLFDPTAVHKLAGDTLWSSLTISGYGDSVRAAWRAGWIRAYCGEGL